MYLEKHHSVSYLNHAGNLALLRLWCFSDLKYTVKGKARKQFSDVYLGKKKKQLQLLVTALDLNSGLIQEKNHWISLEE